MTEFNYPPCSFINLDQDLSKIVDKLLSIASRPGDKVWKTLEVVHDTLHVLFLNAHRAMFKLGAKSCLMLALHSDEARCHFWEYKKAVPDLNWIHTYISFNIWYNSEKFIYIFKIYSHFSLPIPTPLHLEIRFVMCIGAEEN